MREPYDYPRFTQISNWFLNTLRLEGVVDFSTLTESKMNEYIGILIRANPNVQLIHLEKYTPHLPIAESCKQLILTSLRRRKNNLNV